MKIENDKEDQIKKMAGLLMSNATMLKYHCPNCKMPLFENKETVFCSSCGPVKIVKESKESSKNNRTINNRNIQSDSTNNNSQPENKEMGNFILENKRAQLLKRLVEEDNLDNINKILEALERLKRIDL